MRESAIPPELRGLGISPVSALLVRSPANDLVAEAPDELPPAKPYSGPVTVLIWIAAIAGSWALVVGAISLAAFLIDRIAGLIGGMG